MVKEAVLVAIDLIEMFKCAASLSSTPVNPSCLLLQKGIKTLKKSPL
jgi:hypothetical protein